MLELLFQCLFIVILIFTQFVNLSHVGYFSFYHIGTPLCIGDQVEVECYLLTLEQYRVAEILFSFNSSLPFSISQLNSNAVVDGIDLSRYSASVDVLTVRTDRPGIKLIIHSYQPSDSETIFGCHAEFSNYTLSSALVSGRLNAVVAAPPSAPSLQIFISNFNTATCSAEISLSWNTPPNGRTIDRYFLYLDGSLLATTTSNSYYYIHSIILNINTDYQYSLTAMNCAGNSTNSSVIVNFVESLSLMKSPLCLEYNNYRRELTVNWVLDTLKQPSEAPGLDITYSLQLRYSQLDSRHGVTYTYRYTDSTSFTLPSSQLSNNIVLNTHNFAQGDGVETNIEANLTIVQKCGQPFNGTIIQCFLGP